MGKGGCAQGGLAGEGLGDSPPHQALVTQSLHPTLPIPLLFNSFSSCWQKQGWQSVCECMCVCWGWRGAVGAGGAARTC